MDTRRDFIFVDDLVNVVMQAVWTGRAWSLPRLLGLGLLDQGAVRRHDRRARVQLEEEVEVRPRGDDDAYTILLDPSRIRADFGWDITTPLEQGVARAIDYYKESGSPRPTRICGSANDRELDERSARILVVGGAGFVGSNLVRALLEREPEQMIVVDNLLSTERENVPDDPARDVARGIDHRQRRRSGACPPSSTWPSSSPRTMAIRARLRTRSPTTSTTPTRRCGSSRRSRTPAAAQRRVRVGRLHRRREDV